MNLAEAIEEVADALRPLRDEVADLQVAGYWNDDPTPPCLDVFPGNPFQTGSAFQRGGAQVFLTVRARVGMADVMAGQALLLRMLDPEDPLSVEAALWDADWAVVVEGVSGFTQYADDVATVERLLGCEWRVTKFL